jgi:hypothetical protein
VKRGICKLCLIEKDLQNSHLIPRSFYKKARSTGRGNTDPFTRTVHGMWRSSYQVRDYVFCRDCEQRLNDCGESYVSRVVATQSTFPLLTTLESSKNKLVGPEWAAYANVNTPQIDRDKIAYFALSVCWRASVHTWKLENGDNVSINLGKRYNEELRRFLMNETPVPRNASLIVVACTDVHNQNAFFMPAENAKTNDKSVGFMARGLMFVLRMSKTLKPFQERLSMINTKDRWISSYDCTKKRLWFLSE